MSRKFGLSSSELLEQFPEIRITQPENAELRFLTPLKFPNLADDPPAGKIVSVVDTETTGLTKDDEVVHLSKLDVVVTSDHKIVPFRFKLFEREPTCEFNTEALEVTGIDPDTLKGKTITPEDLAIEFSDTSMIIAHNARFDRQMLERLGLDRKRIWADTAFDVDHKKNYGCGSSSLAVVMAQGFGVYMNHHDAMEDTVAAFKIMERHFEEIMSSVFSKSYTAIVTCPYDDREKFKELGFYWQKATKEWHRSDLSEGEMDELKPFVENLSPESFRVEESNVFLRYT